MPGTGEKINGGNPLGFGEMHIGGKRVQVTHEGTHDLAQSWIGTAVEAGSCAGGNSIGRGRSVNGHSCLRTNGMPYAKPSNCHPAATQSKPCRYGRGMRGA